MAPMLDLSAHRQLVAQSSGLRFQGKVVQVVGLSIEVEGLRLPLGEICHLYPERATAGIHFAKVMKELGVWHEVADRLKPAPNGATAMRALAARP